MKVRALGWFCDLPFLSLFIFLREEEEEKEGGRLVYLSTYFTYLPSPSRILIKIGECSQSLPTTHAISLLLSLPHPQPPS